MKFIAAYDECNVQYGCLSVMDAAALEDSKAVNFLHFEGPHWCQGFAWMPGTVNFLMLNNDCELSSAFVEVYLSDHIELCPDTIRAIQVPFSVGRLGVCIPNDGARIISGTATKLPSRQKIAIPVPSGQYALVCEMKFRDDEEYLNSERYRQNNEVGLTDMWCRLIFVAQEDAPPAILRADEFLNLERYGGTFLMEAEEA
ncbi:MAG: competence protein ComJ [Thermosynechococcaceae cyanobacterium]